MNFFQPIRDALSGLVDPVASLPLDKRTVAVSLGEPQALAHTMTVDKLHGILREAEGGECQRLFALYRDIRFHAHCQTVINQRKLSVLNKALAIVPGDPTKPEDVQAAKAAQILTRIAGWTTVAMNHLLNGHLYPVAVLEQVYERAPANDLGLMYQPKEWAMVPYHLLDFTDGCLKIWDADPARGHRLGTKQEPQPIRHVVHRGHLLNDIPDNWGGPMRAALFWWLFAVMDRDWWVRFLNRFGTPFIVGSYDTADTTAKRLLTSAFSQASQAFGLVVSKETEIAIHSVTTSSHGEAYQKMQEFANGELSKLFIGQTMTVTAQAGGLGGAQAEVQDSTKGDIEAWDLTALAATVNAHIISPFLAANGIAGRAVLNVATDTAKELEGKTGLLEVAAKIGLELTDAGIRSISDASGLPFQRRAMAAPSAPLMPTSFAATTSNLDLTSDRTLMRYGLPTDAQLDSIATLAAPKLAAAFRGRYAVVADLLAASTSATDLEHRLHVHFSDLDSARLQPLLEDALTAYAATGAATARAKP